MLDTHSNTNIPRREFIKKSMIASGGIFTAMVVSEKFITPAITASAAPLSASSKPKCNNGLGNGEDCPPPGIVISKGGVQNDDPANPGDPQYQGNGGN